MEKQAKELRILATSFAKAGFKVFKVKGKEPAHPWRKFPYTQPEDVVTYLDKWKFNYGIAPNERQLVIDADPRNFDQGDKPHLRLLEEAGIDIKTSSTLVQTGGDGLHIFYNLPELPQGMEIKKNYKNYKGLDFITDGAYVVGAGSIHPDTKRPYRLLEHCSIEDMKEAPQELLDLLLVPITSRSKITKELEAVKDEDEQTLERYIEYLNLEEPAVEGDSGDAKTFQVACAGRDYGLSAGKTLELMLEHYNPRCQPPWGADELELKIYNAYQYATGAAGSKAPESDFDKVEKIEVHPQWPGWSRLEGTTVLKRNVSNVICQFINIHENPKNPLYDCLAFNQLSNGVMKTKWMPWDKDEGKRMPEGGLPWTDSDCDDLRSFLSMTRRFDISDRDIINAVRTMARWKPYHPVREYIRTVDWDGIDRLETWLIDNTSMKDNKVNRAVSKITIMQAVARVFSPGCQADVVTILEGDQGIGKSSIVRILGGEWYGDVPIDPKNKDTCLATRTKWILEISEMAVTRKSDAQELKSYLTKTTDTYRPPYGREVTDVPRQHVYIGTMNKDATGAYLDDPTGNRRYAPVDLGRGAINLAGLKKIRDQLFAEAYHRIHLGGENWHITDRAIIRELEGEQRKRQVEDPYIGTIRNYVFENKPFRITATEVWEKALLGSRDKIHQGHSRRIANSLRDLGYYRKTYRFKGTPVSGFENVEYRDVAAEDLLS